MTIKRKWYTIRLRAPCIKAYFFLKKRLRKKNRPTKKLPDNLVSPVELTLRWGVTKAVLQRWRWDGSGPHYIKLGHHIWYPVEEITIFEKKLLRRHTGEKRQHAF